MNVEYFFSRKNTDHYLVLQNSVSYNTDDKVDLPLHLELKTLCSESKSKKEKVSDKFMTFSLSSFKNTGNMFEF